MSTSNNPSKEKRVKRKRKQYPMPMLNYAACGEENASLSLPLGLSLPPSIKYFDMHEQRVYFGRRPKMTCMRVREKRDVLLHQEIRESGVCTFAILCFFLGLLTKGMIGSRLTSYLLICSSTMAHSLSGIAEVEHKPGNLSKA